MSFTEFPDVSEKFAAIATAGDLPRRLSTTLNEIVGATAGSSSSDASDPCLAGDRKEPTFDEVGASKAGAAAGTAGLASSGTRATFICAARRMSPELSYGRHSGPAPATARAAAVMLLLFQREGRWRLPITKRPAALTRHGGQISLPGGRIELGETSAAAAQRELIEELGVGQFVTHLGQLPERYVFASDYVVTPHVACVDAVPEWVPDAREVERVVELPLEVLFSPACLGRTTIHRGPLSFSAPCFEYGNDRIWGVTAVILAELADSLCRAFETAQRSN
jgi:8-oxo-dGTP pyrophosphatase MutT (NUDIX family)